DTKPAGSSLLIQYVQSYEAKLGLFLSLFPLSLRCLCKLASTRGGKRYLDMGLRAGDSTPRLPTYLNIIILKVLIPVKICIRATSIIAWKYCLKISLSTLSLGILSYRSESYGSLI
ncbi:hypothetical protein NPIL_584741, partial [Nephila pilipes]